jgi:hypothetical protein
MYDQSTPTPKRPSDWGGMCVSSRRSTSGAGGARVSNRSSIAHPQSRRLTELTDSTGKLYDTRDDAYLITDRLKRANSIEGFSTQRVASSAVVARRRATGCSREGD